MASLPFSAVIKLKEDEKNDGDSKKKTREEWKKAKELEEARKAGTVPAAVDEEGKDINPHIPQYISTAPWYFGSLGPTLKHQRPQPEKQKEFDRLSAFYSRGQKGKQSNKFRKGACANCGAMGHFKRDCFERPRKVGAKFSNKDIAADDIMLPSLKLDYDGKRDRWNGFESSEYKAVIEEHQKVEEYKRQLKAEKLKSGEVVDGDDDDDLDDGDDDKYAENIDMPGTKVDSKQRITVRNLRIREDTAKYLRNLDPNSAYYDPKTRAMRDNPYKNTGKDGQEVDYAGENFVRFTGHTVEQAEAQLFAWDAYEKGIDVSLQADPTKLQILQNEFGKKKDQFKQKVSTDLMEKYGGMEHLEAPPRELLLAQTENYVEYSRDGKILKGSLKEIVRSRYEEDIHPNNHVSVWGSYWKDGNWGYKCCHSFVKNSYCMGESGKAENAESLSCFIPSTSTIPTPAKSLLEIHSEKRELEDSSEEENVDMKKKKLRNALIKAKLEEEMGEEMYQMDDRKRKYNSMYNVPKLTEEEIEAYQIRRQRPEDPMANFSK